MDNSGFRDYFGPHAACLVEWPERVGQRLALPTWSCAWNLLPGRRALLSAQRGWRAWHPLRWLRRHARG
jgi:tRNA A37 threonylcarbamoyladenosine biosynthesis protein TsaE